MPLACFAAYVLFNAALSRVGLHLVLNVLRQQRSAELIGGGFVVFLAVCSFIPPVDTSWLTAIGGDVQAVPDSIIEDAALALMRVPSGYFADALLGLRLGHPLWALKDVFALADFTLLTMVLAYGLLLDFHRKTGRGRPGRHAAGARVEPLRAHDGRCSRTLVVREALDLWHNPRARLLASVPFVLSASCSSCCRRGRCSTSCSGKTTDAWVMGGLCVYGAIVMASTFSQNAFAYDGHGFTVFLAAPLPLGDVLKAKNLVHAGAAAFALAGVLALLPGVLPPGRLARRVGARWSRWRRWCRCC